MFSEGLLYMMIDLVKYYMSFNKFISKLDKLNHTDVPNGYITIERIDAKQDTKENTEDKNPDKT